MTLEQTVERLKKEIKGQNRKDVINSLEEMLCKNVKELIKSNNFFHLPLKNIFSVIAKINFNYVDDIDDGYEILLKIIKNTTDAHYEEKETLMILQIIDITQIILSYERILSIFGLFTNCPILQLFCNLYNENQLLPEKDYEYELQQKGQEIEKLKQQKQKEFNKRASPTKIEFQPISEKPKDFEPDIFKACKSGKFTSVQWLIEKENIDPNISVEQYNFRLLILKGDTPIHIASKNGHLPIVQYLIEKQNVNIDIKGFEERTSLHYACEKCKIPIINYLISQGANINEKDKWGNNVIHYASIGGYLPIVQYIIGKQSDCIDAKGGRGKTPLHCACSFANNLPVVEYLISKGANVDAKDNDSWTPLHFAANNHRPEIVKYLVSKGANKNIKNTDGKTPYDYADIDEIKNILK